LSGIGSDGGTGVSANDGTDGSSRCGTGGFIFVVVGVGISGYTNSFFFVSFSWFAVNVVNPADRVKVNPLNGLSNGDSIGCNFAVLRGCTDA
jgi:hypothetical protein